MSVIKRLAELATKLDDQGLYDEASVVDSLLTKLVVEASLKVKSLQTTYNKELERAKQLGVDVSKFPASLVVDGVPGKQTRAAQSAFRGLRQAATSAQV